MANNVMFNVRSSFDMNTFLSQMVGIYQAKGYAVNVVNMNGVYIITFDKDTGGINTLLGLGEGIKATVMRMNDILTINFSDEEWESKIIGFGVGLLLCAIPCITAAIGTYRQSCLPKNIANDASILVAQM